MPQRQLSPSLEVSPGNNPSSGRRSEAGDFVWMKPLTAEVVDGDYAKHRRFQFYGPGPGGYIPRVRRCRGDESSIPERSCTAESVAGKSNNREADPGNDMLTNPVATDDGAHGPILSRCIDIDQAGRSDFASVPRDVVPDNSWNIRTYVLARVRARLTQGAIACIQVYLKRFGCSLSRLVMEEPTSCRIRFMRTFCVALLVRDRSSAYDAAVRQMPVGSGDICFCSLSIPMLRHTRCASLFCLLLLCSSSQGCTRYGLSPKSGVGIGRSHPICFKFNSTI